MKKDKTQEESIEITGTTQAQFNLAELNVIASIIDVSIRRGLFGANDLTTLATVYNKVISYLPKGANNGQK